METTEIANAKRGESAAAIVKALLDSNRLIARDGASQSVSLGQIFVLLEVLNTPTRMS